MTKTKRIIKKCSGISLTIEVSTSMVFWNSGKRLLFLQDKLKKFGSIKNALMRTNRVWVSRVKSRSRWSCRKADAGKGQKLLTLLFGCAAILGEA